MYPSDIREMAIQIILELIYKSPVLFRQVDSHHDCSCKREYDRCIGDISEYIIRRHYPPLPDEKTKHSDFLWDTRKQVYVRILAMHGLSPSSINDLDKSGRNRLSHAAEGADLQLVVAI